MYTGNEIKEKRDAIKNNIFKSFSNAVDCFEKAHQQGDLHPNGKWYWESSANNGKGDWRTIKKNATNNTATPKSTPAPSATKKVEINVKQVFHDIKGLNPTQQYVSSLGAYINPSDEMLADEKVKEVEKYLPKDSLAYKIISSSKRFTDKQLWVIAYELMKSDEYKKDLSESIERNKKIVAEADALKRGKKAAKKKRKEEQKAKTEALIKKYDSIDSDKIVNHFAFGEGKVIGKDGDKLKVYFKYLGERLVNETSLKTK